MASGQEVNDWKTIDPGDWKTVAPRGLPERPYAQRATDYVTDTLSNVPGSALSMAKNIGTAILHPIDAATGVTKAVAGTLQRMTPGYVTENRLGYSKESEAAQQGLKDRYGSVDAIANTIRKDPVGVASDVSLVAGGVSGIARGASAVARSVPRVASTAAKVADAAATVSDLTNPVNAVTKPVGYGAKLIGRGFVKSALSLPGKSERYGATPAVAALEETSGFTPKAVKESAIAKLKELSGQLDALTIQAEQAGRKADLNPARQAIIDEIAKVKAANGLADDLVPMLDQLSEARPGFAGDTSYPVGANTPITIPQGMTGNPLPLVRGKTPPKAVSPQQSPTVFRDMKHQFGEDFTKFDAAIPLKNAARKAGNQAYHEMATEFNRAVPGAQPLNQRMQSLIPVKDAAARADELAGPVQTEINRATRPTGGMVPVLAGAAARGVPGAAAVMAAQAALANPTMKMVIARGMYGGGKALMSPLTSRTLNAAGAAGAASITPEQINELSRLYGNGGKPTLYGKDQQ